VGDTVAECKLHDQLQWMVEGGALASFHDYHDPFRDGDVVTAHDWRARLWFDNQFCGSTTMVHESVLRSVGGWDAGAQFCVDWLYAMDVEEAAGWEYIPRVWGSAAQYPDGHTAKAKYGPAKRIREVDQRYAALRARRHRQENHGREKCA
jgi:hypothetical protein